MPVFLMVMEGPTPGNAKPILASRDPALLRLVAEELGRRLVDDVPAGAVARILELSRCGKGTGGSRRDGSPSGASGDQTHVS